MNGSTAFSGNTKETKYLYADILANYNEVNDLNACLRHILKS